MARTIFRTIAPPDEDLPALLSRVLGRLARRRLEAGLLDAREVDHLLGLELDGRDDWLVFLILVGLVRDRVSPPDPRSRPGLIRTRSDRPLPPPTRSLTNNRRNS